jgi:hypothetical protein
MGSIFIFGSWVCEADDKGILQGRLVEDLEAREGLTLQMRPTEDLAKTLSGLTVSESTWAPTTTSLDLTSRSDFPQSPIRVLLKTSQVLF